MYQLSKFSTMLFLVITAAVLIQASVFANETDNFTRRDELKKLPDSTEQINDIVNGKIEMVLHRFYHDDVKKRSACRAYTPAVKKALRDKRKYLSDVDPDRTELMDIFRQALDTNFTDVRANILTRAKPPEDDDACRDLIPEQLRPKEGAVISSELKSKYCSPIPQLKLALDDSIYAGTAGVLNSIGGVDASININGHVMGVDKVDHFFGNGFPCYKATKKTGLTDSCLDFSHEQENGKFGLSGTNVKSYGDISANFNGSMFWYGLLDAESSPYVDCNPKTGKYELVKKFNIAGFADDSWDEGINCSSFNSEEKDFLKVVRTNIPKVSGGKSCPLDPASCAELKKKYTENFPDNGYTAGKLLNPNCLAPGSAPFNQEAPLGTVKSLKGLLEIAVPAK